MSRPLATLAILGAVVFAGCAGGIPFTDSADSGTVSLYLSDQENAIDDFRHLNVTVTKVGLKRAHGDWRNHTHDGHHHRNRWVIADVANRTVDLTRLQGPNATLLGNLSVQDGTYKQAFVYVTEVNATLENGSSVHVELPRDRLKVKDRFQVQDGQVVDFVVDVTVVQRDGEYVIVPRASASGEDVSFCRMRGECHCGDGKSGMNGTHDGTHEGTHTTRGGHHGGCDGCDGCRSHHG